MLTLKEIKTAGDFRRQLETLNRQTAAAILFGVEVGLDAEDVATFTWANVKTAWAYLSPYAKQIINSQPRHISSPYLFWCVIDGITFPLFGLNQEVFESFNLTWSELRHAYANMTWIDEEVEKNHFNSLLREIAA